LSALISCKNTSACYITIGRALPMIPKNIKYKEKLESVRTPKDLRLLMDNVKNHAGNNKPASQTWLARQVVFEERVCVMWQR
jgi:hypothetical protein